jgi:electron transport complex protein RnfG
MYRAIVGIGALCALMIVTVFQTTDARIKENQARALRLAVAEVLPQAESTLPVALLDGSLQIVTETPALPVFLGYGEEDELVGAAITAQGMGYQDNVRVLYAYSIDTQAIIGFKVLDSKETPGLGDKIETEPHFVANFESLDATLSPDGNSLLHPIITVKQGQKTEPWQIDGITGATITAVAVGDILNESAQIWAPALQRNADAFAVREPIEEIEEIEEP